MNYIDVDPIIPNTTMQKAIHPTTGRELLYKITVNAGYVIHDKGRDFDVFDEFGNYVETKQGFTTGSTTCGLNYDFEANPREFFTLPENEVPADQVFGIGGGSTPEIM